MIPGLMGFLLVRALGSGPRRWCRHDLLRLVLGIGLGIGLCSACFFLSLLSGIPGLLLELVLILVAAAAALHWNTGECPLCASTSGRREDRVLTAALAGVLGLLMLLDLSIFASVTAREPHGGWDAWAIWNLRARFLFRAGSSAWRVGFTEILDWSHPDYPLLLPAFIARTWKLLGSETQTVPIALGFFFSFGTACLMVTTLSALRGIRQGLLAGIALAATPWLFVQGAIECADVPLAFFRLQALACMALADHFDNWGFAVLAGTAAALDGWTKNEGMLWLVAFLLARVIAARMRHLRALLAGAVPVLAVIVVFKTRVATASDIFGASGRLGMMDRLLDAERYALIARAVIHHLWTFGPLLLSPFLLLTVYLCVVGIENREQDRAAISTATFALAFTAAGYFLIYVLRSLDLQWLLDSSLDRLLLHLWPGIVFTIFFAARTSDN